MVGWNLLLKLVIFSVSKKIVIFLAAKHYGFPLIYRKIAKVGKKHVSEVNRPKFRKLVQFLFRWPRFIYEYFYPKEVEINRLRLLQERIKNNKISNLFRFPSSVDKWRIKNVFLNNFSLFLF